MTGTEARGHYLSLALDSRSAIDLLIDYVETGLEPARFGSYLGELRDSLTAAGEHGDRMHLLEPRSTFQQDEHLRVLNEVKRALDEKNIEGKLAAILSPDVTAGEKKKNAIEALRFFSALEDNALEYYNEQANNLRS